MYSLFVISTDYGQSAFAEIINSVSEAMEVLLPYHIVAFREEMGESDILSDELVGANLV